MLDHENQFITKSPRRAVHLLLIAGFLLALIGVTIADFYFAGSSRIYDPKPNFSDFFVIRSIVLFISAFLLILSIWCWDDRKTTGNSRPEDSVFLKIDSNRFGTLRIGRIAILLFGLILFSAILLLFLASPPTFYRGAQEDWIVEMASSWLYFSCCILLTSLLFRLRGESKKRLKFFVYLCLSAAFFVIGMEEISWGQRFFGFSTPETFALNRQGEFNLHNFASNETEILYYTASFILLVLFGFIATKIQFIRNNPIFNYFAPGSTVIILSVPFTAMNYNLWNFSLVQFSFFASILILVYRSIDEFKQNQLRAFSVILSIITLCIISQFLYIQRGDLFLRSWDITEYKEFWIPLCFFLYTIELYMKERGRVNYKLFIYAVIVAIFMAFFRVLSKVMQ